MVKACFGSFGSDMKLVLKVHVVLRYDQVNGVAHYETHPIPP